MKTFFNICLILLSLTPGQLLWADSSLTINPMSESGTFISRQTIDTTIEPFITDGFEGTIIVSNQHGAIYRRSAGFAIAEDSKYKSSTVVDIASVSKQFTAAAIMKLAEQGKLETNDLISKHIENVSEAKANITIHNLLTHTAGFKRHLGRDEEKLNRDEFIHKALNMPLAFGVGEKYHYSNIGYGLLAFIVEEVSGQDFESYLFDNLLEPAGMFSTGYLKPDWSQRTIPEVKRLYAGYASPLKMLESTDGDFWNLKGGGGIFSTADDMALWHEALMKQEILSKRSQSIMYAPYISEDEEGYFYGYGWSVVPRDEKEPLIWHNGMSFFGKAEYWRLPQSGLMIFVASHKENSSPWRVANAIYKVLEL